MNRRELLRLLSITGPLVAVPNLAADTHADDTEQLDQYELLNSHLWQVFALSESKRTVYPVVRRQVELLTNDLRRAHSGAAHKRLCVLIGDLLQLAGEIFFDADRYTDAAHCYALAADASKEGGAFDLWACALTRHAYLGVYERRFDDVTPILEGAARVARRGDSQLSTRYWVAAVQAEAYAGLGDFDACQRALDTAERVQALTGPAMPGGWLRFDGTRLAEERGTCHAALGRADLATEALLQALNTATSRRRRGGILTDLAALGVQSRDLDQVLDYGGQAAELAEQTGSSGYIGRKLQGLRTELAPSWIAGVHKYYPGEPKPGYVAPWEDTPDWERQAASAVYRQVSDFVEVSGGATAKLTREQKGRFVALCWIAQIHKHIPDPKPSYVADWNELPEWQRQTDADIFEQIEQGPGTTP